MMDELQDMTRTSNGKNALNRINIQILKGGGMIDEIECNR